MTAGQTATRIEVALAWPAKELSPNSRVHRMALSRFKKAAREEGEWQARIHKPKGWQATGDIPVRIIAYPPMAWRTGDDDNLVARLKAHLDGIAKGLGVNDRQFKQQGVEWAERRGTGQIVIALGCDVSDVRVASA